MKRKFYPFICFSTCILLAFMSSAQGIYQFWGMTSQGGTDDIGAIFRTNGRGGNIQSVYSFPKTNLGSAPMYNQLTEYNGKFYAMTSQGGASNLGVIFEWDPVTNIYTKKYDFTLASGINPHGSLAVLNNKLYGMTLFGGANDKGVIFEWDPASNVYTKKYDFTGAGGANPYGSLVVHNGKFYGMTNAGGTNDKGVIFEWSPATNAYTKKYDFDGTNGGNPYGDLALKGGKFYGMTSLGGANNVGVIFEWNPNSNNYIKQFDLSLTTGCQPYGSLLLANNKFYGMTYKGASSIHEGGIFEWDPASNVFTNKHSFYDAEGNPRGNIVLQNGKLYGLASSGYRTKGMYWGYLFEFEIATNSYTTKYLYTKRTNTENTYNGENPYGSLVVKNDKLYGMTSEGGSSGSGVLFEYDLLNNSYTKKINLNAHELGGSPNSVAFQQNKLFGVSNRGGFDGLGSIFEWKFETNSLEKKFDFDGTGEASVSLESSRYPTGKLTFANDRFYGMSYYMLQGGPHPKNHVFEWNPSTNTFAEKYFWDNGNYGNNGSLYKGGDNLYGIIRQGIGMFKYDPITNNAGNITGEYSNGDGNGLAEKEGKLFGTGTGGINNAGIIFEVDLTTNSSVKRYDFTPAMGSSPIGTMLLYNNKFYGMTEAGGVNNMGVIFEWDPATNSYTKKYDFNPANGGNPISSLVLNNDKLYGMTRNGGSNGLGTIFEWDPATNTYTKQSDFDGTNGRNPTAKNELTKVPVDVAGCLPGACESYAPVIIDNANSNKWVPITDDNGLAIAEIKANGNNLGVVTASVFVNNSSVREDGTKRLYLDRNITITPQFQPTTPVDVRLYIRGEELMALKNAVNSNGKNAGVNTIADLGVFKNEDGCGNALQKTAIPVVSVNAAWLNDYVLQTIVSKFSTFYFANKVSSALPLTLLEFSGKFNGNDAVLNWKTENELNTLEFIVERSVNGTQYDPVGKVSAANTNGTHYYNFTDPAVTAMGTDVIYYRLQQKDIDGKFSYSKVISVSLQANKNYVKLYPNPVDNQLNLEIGSTYNSRVAWRVTSMSGASVIQGERLIAAGVNIWSIDVSKLAKGVYLFKMQGELIDKRIQFVKQ